MFSWSVFHETLLARDFQRKSRADPNRREYVCHEGDLFGWEVDYHVLVEQRPFYDIDYPENNNSVLAFTLTFNAARAGERARKLIHVHEMMITEDVNTQEFADELADKFGETVFCEKPAHAGFEMLDDD